MEELFSFLDNCDNDEEVTAARMQENGFWDEFFDEELPDEIFEEIGLNFKGDPCVMVTNVNHVVGGVEVSRFVSVDYETETYEVGPKNTEAMNYTIDHNEKVVVPVMKWAMNFFLLDKVKPFPYVEKASPHIDMNKIRMDDYFALEELLMHRGGYSLYNPSQRLISKCGSFGRMVSVNETMNTESYVEGEKVFLGHGEPTKGMKNYIYMQFNPYHPFSYKYIRQLTVQGDEARGEYEIDGRSFKFCYNLQDTRYRMHSIDWQDRLGKYFRRYHMFDLVADHDFISVFENLEFKVENERGFSEDRVCYFEPLITNREPPVGYSYLGPWKGQIKRGVGKDIVFPYMARMIHYQSRNSYMDITYLSMYRPDIQAIQVKDFCKYCHYDSRFKDDSKCKCDRKRIRMYELKPGSNVFYNEVDKRVYMHVDFEGTMEFIYVTGKIPGKPYNGEKSLVYMPGFVSMRDLKRIVQKRPEFLDIAFLSLKKTFSEIEVMMESRIIEEDVNEIGDSLRVLLKALTNKIIIVDLDGKRDLYQFLREVRPFTVKRGDGYVQLELEQEHEEDIMREIKRLELKWREW
jgi:hypothetical protein